MISSSTFQPATLSHASHLGTSSSKKVLKMVKNDRMGGMVPAWVSPDSFAEAKSTARQNIERTLSSAQTGNPAGLAAPDHALAYHHGDVKETTPSEQDEFRFRDLIDMINPLHHIPVIGHLYRQITGDTIKPVSTLIGGALFGGPLGAATGAGNLIVQHETGKTIEEHIVSMTSRRPASAPVQDDLPASLLAFSTRAYPEILIDSKNNSA